jgi:hypothetical protein
MTAGEVVANAVATQAKEAALKAVMEYMRVLVSLGQDKMQVGTVMIELFNATTEEARRLFPDPPPLTRMERARKRLEKPPEDEHPRPVIIGSSKKLSKQMLWVMEKAHLIKEILLEKEQALMFPGYDVMSARIRVPLPMGTRRDGVLTVVLVDAMLREGKAKNLKSARTSLSRSVRRLWYRGLIEVGNKQYGWSMPDDPQKAFPRLGRITRIRPVARLYLPAETVDCEESQ